MRRILIALALLLTAGAVEADVGAPLPSMTLHDLSGAAVDVASLRGQIVYLDFWASWCAPCRKSFPFMNELKQRYEKSGVVVLAVNVDEQRADADAFLARYKADFRVLVDPAGAAPRTLGVKGMPSSYLIDRDGVVRFAHTGFRDNTPADVSAEIESLLK